MCTKKKNNKGFTLVEVIVVAVIVAVLALVAIQLYTGYVNDARENTSENLAASAAGFLTTERNRGSTITVGTVTGPALIGSTNPDNDPADIPRFQVPTNASLTITGSSAVGGTVTATVGTGTNAQTSQAYNW